MFTCECNLNGFHICNEGTWYRLKRQPMHSAKDIDEKSENKYYRKSPFSLKQNDEGSCSTAVGIALLRSAACSLFQMHSAGMSCVVVVSCDCLCHMHFYKRL